MDIKPEKAEQFLAMAKATYEPQMTAHLRKDQPILLPGAWSAGGKVYENPWDITFFGPLVGEFKYSVNGAPDSMSCWREYQMYWVGFPDFRLTDYKIFLKEDGWIARITFGGTAPDGQEATVHQADFATVSDDGRLVRMEWFVDTYQWQNQVLMKCSGLTIPEIREIVHQPSGYNKLIDLVLARRQPA